MSRPPKILVFDSGLGGLTVFAEIAALRPDAQFVYAADEAGFPYGALPATALAPRVLAVMGRLIDLFSPDVAVIACNTASTLVLPHLRAAFPDLPFVGTVPAIKPAAQTSQSKMISVLATPGTVARDYTRGLIEAYAADCKVMLVGSSRLASLAEDFMQGDAPSDAAILDEIAPAFVEAEGRRTDAIALACTHYPLLIAQFERLAPWPVAWIDPAPAIARRTDHVLTAELGFAAGGGETARKPALAVFTGSKEAGPKLREALRLRGIAKIALEPMPLVFA
ncbi:glutamate racemase [Methylocella silvestris BL2]|uniref:Glutamate racemase n=1 Tax=Methylocella silvestris (strain DSM 15510 / CIP 108128 / LMG 27833 / NCIMB 13906 / BL2) TaxID=395965 RepID=B8EQU9_METSB|nr:glutamate racemase [Methylocella silvestris]ACK49370.1 glutamate racemase [Methylocella silvestris BL2]